MTGLKSRYAGRRVSLLTQHGKELLIGPIVDGALGCHVERVTGFDTDNLGTFTRDIPRAGTQLEAARTKARIGMDLSGLPLGLANEGTFGPDPMVGLFAWNVELLIFIDDEADLEITGIAQGKATHAHLLTGEWESAENFARQSGFPEYRLVVRPEGENDNRLEKGIGSWAELQAAFGRALACAANAQVFLEHDLRAHANPSRQENIRLAAEDLVLRVQSLCPTCATPGFWLIERTPGLRCGSCGTPTREAWAETYGCLRCDYRHTRELPGRDVADPSSCDYCNP